jgi:hypothetical protein
VANGDISTIITVVPCRGGGNAATCRLRTRVVVCVCDQACSSEITAGCNANISSFLFAFGVDMGYYDVVAGVEGDITAVFACGVYGPCLNVA